eukprot:617555-Pyramimonas_sp.AAC.1
MQDVWVYSHDGPIDHTSWPCWVSHLRGQNCHCLSARLNCDTMWPSWAEVGSSTTNRGVLRKSVRARLMRCRSESDTFVPFEPTCVTFPSRTRYVFRSSRAGRSERDTFILPSY